MSGMIKAAEGFLRNSKSKAARPVSLSAGPPYNLLSAAERAALREVCLDEIAGWYAGHYASPGTPAESNWYAGELQSAVRRCDEILAALKEVK